jgi:hypothetical protein
MKAMEGKLIESPFTAPKITHADIAAFADTCVNLKREDARFSMTSTLPSMPKVAQIDAISPLKKPATAFLLELIALLQSSATVPMIDVRAYAGWLSR